MEIGERSYHTRMHSVLDATRGKMSRYIDYQKKQAAQYICRLADTERVQLSSAPPTGAQSCMICP